MPTDSQIVKINQNNQKYPKRLKHIPDPPKILYCRGNLELLNTECIAVVGTRKLTSYGKEACQTITADLARAGFTIVSGLAFGIDAIAHEATVDVGGNAIVVLGGGVDDKSIGPKANLPLAKNILKNNGLIISEYEAGSVIYPSNFAVRDRIISGLSIGVLVVEADLESGSLITAKSALDQNRDVFAVPGSIFSVRSTGSNDLIKNGAKLVMSARDVIEEYGNNLSLFKQIQDRLSTEDPVQKTILGILEARGASSIDLITTESNYSSSKILSALSVLEMNGLITRLGNGTYRRT